MPQFLPPSTLFPYTTLFRSTETAPALSSIAEACARLGTEDSVVQFASTSKITHAGAGVAFVSASPANLKGLKAFLSTSTIAPDKITQIRHARFLPNQQALHTHMRKHAQLLQPRFEAVLQALESEFKGTDLGTWETPIGGYFVSFDTRPNCARETVRLAAEAGVTNPRRCYLSLWQRPPGPQYPHRALGTERSGSGLGHESLCRLRQAGIGASKTGLTRC